MIKIYHNPRCGKSREGLQILQDSGKSFEVIEYMGDNPLTFDKLQNAIMLLKIKPVELIRKNEVTWKENYKDKKLSNKRLIELMIKYPQLMERPIVINGDKAVIGRPPSKLFDII